MTDYIRPTTLDEAVTARGNHPQYLLMAGCTDLMVGRIDAPDPPGVIDLFGLDELVGIGADDDYVLIGAATPYADILNSELVQTHLPALWASVREIGAVQIQQRGTLGGNIGTSSPVGDTLPVLLALDATIEVEGPAGARAIPYSEYCTGYRTTALRDDEIIIAARFPLPNPNTQQYWRKVGTRKAQAISKVMLAAAADLAEDGTISRARIAFGAVADRPVRIGSVENLMVGRAPSAALAAEVKTAVEGAITPITDQRSTAEYRAAVAGNLAARFIRTLED